MSQNVYECLFILDANRYARDPNNVAGAIPKMIEDLGGEVLANRLWNEQRLAYPIKGHRKGTYWLTYFRLDSSRTGEFTRACQLNDNILRHLVLKVDSRLVDVLVSHAQGKSVGDEPPAEPATSGETPKAEEGAGSTESTVTADTSSG